jgi:hypothetical protein
VSAGHLPVGSKPVSTKVLPGRPFLTVLLTPLPLHLPIDSHTLASLSTGLSGFLSLSLLPASLSLFVFLFGFSF